MNNCGKFNNNLNILGPVLRQKRLERKMSFETLSAKLLLLGVNIPVTSLHRIENNQRTIRDYEICAFSVALNVDISELLSPAVNSLFKVS